MKVNIIQTSDLHGYVLPKTYHDEKKSNIGLSKISSLINNIRNKDNINLLIDTGDSYQGNPIIYNYIKNHANLPNPMALIFNYLKYDAHTIGNHEFDYGKENLNNFINECTAPWLCCNVKNFENILNIKPYTIKNYDNGLKIGLIGATTKYIPNWIDSKILNPLEFLDPVESIEKIVNEIRSKVDIIIVTYHGGLEKDPQSNINDGVQNGENQGFEILSKIKGIDVLLLGHQHRHSYGKYNNIPYVMPLPKGSMIGSIQLNIEEDTNGKLIIKDSTSSTLNVEEYESDKNIENIFKPYEEKGQEWLDRKISKLNKKLIVQDFFKARLEKHPIIQFINNIQMELTNADISVIPLFDNTRGFDEDVSVRDVLSACPYANTLKVLKMSGAKIKEALEKTANYFTIENGEISINKDYIYPKAQHYQYDMWDGIKYTIKVSNPLGEKIVSLTYEDVPIKDNDCFNVVVNSYRANGGGDYKMFKESQVVAEIDIDTTELLLKYFENNPSIDFTPINNVTIIK